MTAHTETARNLIGNSTKPEVTAYIVRGILDDGSNFTRELPSCVALEQWLSAPSCNVQEVTSVS